MTLRVHPDQIVRDSTSPLLAVASSWGRVRLGDVAEIVNGAAFRSDRFNSVGRGLPLIRIRDVGADDTSTYYDGEYDDRHVVEPGDLLIGMDGDFRVARWRGRRALLNQRVCKIEVRPGATYSDRFLMLCLQPYLDAVHAVTSAVTVKHLSSRTIADLPLPHPSLDEQGRIVAVVEEYLSDIEAAFTSLRRAELGLERLWAASCAGFFSDHWPRRPLDELCDPSRPICYGILKPKTDEPGSVPYVEVRSIVANTIVVEHLHLTTERLHKEFRRSELRGGDVVMAVRGSWDRAAVVPESLDGANVSRDVARIAPQPELLAEFLVLFLTGWEAGRFFGTHARGVAVKGVNIGDLRRLPVPAPSVEDQRRIVEQSARLREVVDSTLDDIRLARRRSVHLRKAVLGAAMSGRFSGDALVEVTPPNREED